MFSLKYIYIYMKTYIWKTYIYITYIYIYMFSLKYSWMAWLASHISHHILKCSYELLHSFAGFIRQAILVVWEVYSYWSFKLQLKHEFLLDPKRDLVILSLFNEKLFPPGVSLLVSLNLPSVTELLEGRDDGLFILIFQCQAQGLEFTRCSRNIWWISEQVPLSQLI